MATIVSIGRNVGDRPMAGDRWDAFKREVRAEVRRAAGPIVFAGDDDGWREGETWDEQSYTVIGASKATGATFGTLTATLYQLAAAFEQDAIAVTVAGTRFVGPNAFPWETR